MTTTTPAKQANTTAFFIQSAISFAVAALGMILGIIYLPADPWMRAFLALGTLYLITSTFTLAKVVRDQQESSTLVNRVDKARLDKFLAEHDLLSSL